MVTKEELIGFVREFRPDMQQEQLEKLSHESLMGMVKKITKTGQEFKNKEEIILRDYLALERTRLANERTLLSYIWASLYLLLGGLAFLQLRGFDAIKWIGYLSLGLSFIIIVIGISKFYHLKKSLRKHYKLQK